MDLDKPTAGTCYAQGLMHDDPAASWVLAHRDGLEVKRAELQRVAVRADRFDGTMRRKYKPHALFSSPQP